MTAEQLEEMLAAWDAGSECEGLQNLAPSLARRVIAAEKLVEAGNELQRLWSIGTGGRDLSWRVSLEGAMEDHVYALTAYRDASK